LCAPRSQAWPPHSLTDWRQHKEESCPAYRKSRVQVHSFGRRCSCGKSPQNQQMQSHRGSLIARLISSSLQDRRSYQLCHCDPYRRRLRKSTRNLLNTEGNGHRWSILQESSRIPPYCNKGFHKDYQTNVSTNIMCNFRLQPQSQLHIVVVALMNWFCRHSGETTKSSSAFIFCLVRWALSQIVSRGRE
jgi:hypothetical protein